MKRIMVIGCPGSGKSTFSGALHKMTGIPLFHLDIRLQACDTVVFLDYPLEICLHGITERRGKARTDIPWIEPENEEDTEFIEFIKNYNSENRPQVMELLHKYSYKDIYIFKNRNEADEFLNRLQQK